MRTVLAIVAIAALALAGCSSKSTPDNYTCQMTGKVIDLSQVAGSSKKGFDPESACPAPLPPSVAFVSVPSSMEIYFPAVVSWKVLSGNYTGGHSMFNGVVLFHHPVDDAQLVPPDSTSPASTLCSYAHQDVLGSAPFSCKIKFTTAGTYGLRIYAQVRGTNLEDHDYWTPEVKVTVNPVNASGKTTPITHAAGPVTASGQGGTFTPNTVSAVLGDGIVLVNQDLTAHTFSFTGGCKHDDVKVAAPTAPGGSVASDPVLMVTPGSCVIKTDDAPTPQSASINVAEPI